MVVEVASSSASYDLHSKLRVYEKHGVREYLVWRVRDEAFDWFVRRGDRFEKLPTAADGVLRSEVFPGLWLDAPPSQGRPCRRATGLAAGPRQ